MFGHYISSYLSQYASQDDALNVVPLHIWYEITHQQIPTIRKQPQDIVNSVYTVNLVIIIGR